ncbi:hypothetical protein [Mycoplasmopsis agassizii]|uniref:Uncharacterized protein n=2 Tax=Mycoplasmopsis agassizii TaxID=33922 RepID=A0ABX4H657_9BACT|nr:hypothetical protein [Mycoplasmopsis agassizii]PAF55369.1 hypothetical protein CJF60_01615 [Mycoplasmopsis agassizii]
MAFNPILHKATINFVYTHPKTNKRKVLRKDNYYFLIVTHINLKKVLLIYTTKLQFLFAIRIKDYKDYFTFVQKKDRHIFMPNPIKKRVHKMYLADKIAIFDPIREREKFHIWLSMKNYWDYKWNPSRGYINYMQRRKERLDKINKTKKRGNNDK